MKRVMVDIETFSIKPNAVIRSIGAYKWGDDNNETFFFDAIDTDKLDKQRFAVDGSTIKFWEEQPPEAQAQFKFPSHPLNVLVEFAALCEDCDEIWCKGLNFDIVILEHAFNAFGVTIPWKYSAVRDFRTMLKYFPVEITPHPQPVAHHALWDAVNQAQQLRAILEIITHGA